MQVPTDSAGPPGIVRRVLGDDTNLYLLGMALATALLTVGNIVAARVLGPSGKGQLALVIASATFAVAFTSPGLDQAIARGFAIGGPARTRAASALPASMLIVAVVPGIASGVICILTLPHAGSALVIWAVAAGAAFGVLALLLTALVGLRKPMPLLKARVVGAVITLAVIASLALVGLTVSGAIAAFVVGSVATGALALLEIARTERLHWISRPVGLGAALKVGMRAGIGQALIAVNYRFDFLLVASIAGSSQLGIYSISVSVIEVFWMWADASSQAVAQGAAAARDPALARRVLAHAMRRTGAGLTVGCLLVIGFGFWLIPAVFGAAFSQAYLPAVALLPGMLAVGLWKVLNAYLFARGFDYAGTLTAGIGAAAGLALDLLLIPRFGIVGAAIAASIGYSVTLAIAVVAFYVRERRQRPGLDAGTTDGEAEPID
jgi:O-antigen/teichoic acid export membrane protein